MKRGTVSLALLLAGLAAPAQAFEPPDFVNRLVNLVNSVRTATHLPALALNPSVEQAARAYAVVMANQNWLSHIGPDGTTAGDRDRLAGYGTPAFWGEDLAAGCPTPEEVFTAWMNSPPHRALILFPGFTDIGVGVQQQPGTPYGIYWALEFAAGATQPPPTGVPCFIVPP